jgi:hypothetical protein
MQIGSVAIDADTSVLLNSSLVPTVASATICASTARPTNAAA